MNSRIKALLIVVLSMSSISSYAFDLSKLSGALGNGNSTVESVLNGVVGTSNIEIKDIAGTWKSAGPAVSFESNELLQNAGGIAVATTIENKIYPYYQKAGLQNMTMAIDASGKFTINFKTGKLTGTAVKQKSGHFIFKFNSLGKYPIGNINTYIKKGTSLEVLFDASKMVDILSKVAQYSGYSTATSAMSILKNYNGIYAGFKLKK